ncbi:repeat protein [Bifidobacterium ramosum]|nr:repeat protein [Bifidobacterium ramosum]
MAGWKEWWFVMRIIGRLGVVWAGVVLAVAMVLSVMTPVALAADAKPASIKLDWNTQSVSKEDFTSGESSSVSGSLNAGGVWMPSPVSAWDDPIARIVSGSRFGAISDNGDGTVRIGLDGWNTKADGTGDWYDFSSDYAYSKDGADCGKDATGCYVFDVVRNGLRDASDGGVKYPAGGVLYAQWKVSRWSKALPDKSPEQKVTRSQLKTFVANTVWDGSYFTAAGSVLYLNACSAKNNLPNYGMLGSCMSEGIPFGALRVGKSGKAAVSFADRVSIAEKSGVDFDAWADQAFNDRTYRYIVIGYYPLCPMWGGNCMPEAEAVAAIDMDRSDSSAVSFKDVDAKTPHADDIEWLASSGISTGWKEADGSSTFRGMSSVKRQDMAAFLYRLAASPKFDETKVRNPFRDVTSKTPHYKEIMWLYSTGVSTGWKMTGGSYEFRGMNSVVRQDMAAFLHRLADYEKAKPTLGKDVTFRDVTSSTPHSADIAWLAKTGVTTGWKEQDGSKTYRGMSTVKRQDMAAFLHRMKLNVLK